MTSNDKRGLSEPIKVNPSNPHYFMYNNEPILLITSAEHYGAVINNDFDYVAYFDTLREYELNYTRIYPGALIEIEGMFIEDNTLAPKPGSLIVPWARSNEPGCADGGNKFDLHKWDEKYFSRLKDFVAQAANCEIFVEICFYNCQYPEGWPYCPLNADNNIQAVGNCHFNDFQTLKHPDLVRAQEAYVRKIVEEVNEFDNVILEICDEPTLHGTPAELAVPWISHMADIIIKTERKLPKKHLIAQQLEIQVDFTSDGRIPVVVSQYINHGDGTQIGGIEALDTEYDHNKPIELNETGYYPIWYHGDKHGASRAEAWEFMVGGGAGFNQLNGIFTVKNPGGKTTDNIEILGALRNLKRFMYTFEFAKMHQDKLFVKGGIPEGASVRCISEPGRQYALYLHHGTEIQNATYTVTPGNYNANLMLELPAGSYRADWVDPKTGAVIGSEDIDTHTDSFIPLSSPVYVVDIALRIKST